MIWGDKYADPYLALYVRSSLYEKEHWSNVWKLIDTTNSERRVRKAVYIDRVLAICGP